MSNVNKGSALGTTNFGPNLMQKHETGKTRITVERISVTTVRRQGAAQPVHCDICRQLIEPRSEQPLLTGECGADDDETLRIETEQNTTKGRNKMKNIMTTIFTIMAIALTIAAQSSDEQEIMKIHQSLEAAYIKGEMGPFEAEWQKTTPSWVLAESTNARRTFQGNA